MERRNSERVSGADPGNAVWRRQDTHSGDSVPACELGKGCVGVLRRQRSFWVPLELTVEVEASALASLEMKIQQILADLDLGGKVVVEKERM